MLPALPPEPKPGKLPAVPPQPSAPAPSFFDWFKPKSTLPAVQEETLPAPAEPAARKPGIFDWLKPKPYTGPKDVAVAPEKDLSPIKEVPGILQRFVKGVRDMVSMPKPGEIIQAPEMFKHIQATPEEEQDLAKAQQMKLWDTLFPEPEKGTEPDVPLAEMFRPFAPEDLTPAAGVQEGAPAAPPREEMLPPVPQENLKFLPLPSRNDLLPTPMDMARGFMTRYEPIEDLWTIIRDIRQATPFQREVSRGLEGKGAGARWTFETIGMCAGNPDAFQGLASFLAIPWHEFVQRGEPEAQLDDNGEEVLRLTNFERIYEEIIFPATELVYQAFELIKPGDLPGHISLEWGGHKDHSCQLIVSYVEGSPLAPDPMPAEPEAAPQSPSTARTLGELVPEGALADITEIMNALLSKRIDKGEATRRLMFVLEPFDEELRQKGVVSGYLAMYLLSSAEQMGGQ
jgi:hypothetical protein